MTNKSEDISSKIWAMANELRGNMDGNEYKNYILGFLFYRYLSEHQEDYLVSNGVIDVTEGQSINDAYNEQASGKDEKEYLEDISATLGYAIAPNDTWISLNEKINEGLVAPSDYQALFDNFNKNTELNEEASKDFSGVFNDINLGDSRLGSSTAARAKAISKIIGLVDDIDYKQEDGKDVLGEIYEYLIGKFAASSGKKGGEFYTPHEVSKILAKLVTMNVEKSDNTFTVYDPTMGSGSLLLTVGNQLPGGNDVGAIKYYGQEKNYTTYNLARMNLMMHGVSFNNMVVNNADTLELDWPDGLDSQGNDQPRSFDAVVANPPYSAKWDNAETKLKDPRFSEYGRLAPASKADYAFILHSIYHLNNTGTMAVVLPHGVLFRGGAEGQIRKKLLEKNYLDAVIGLPSNLFYGATIPTVILVFKKNKQNKDILFIDSSEYFTKGKNQNVLSDDDINRIIETVSERKEVERFSKVASFKTIKENDFNLNIPRYVDTFIPEEPVDLELVDKNIAEIDEKIEALEKEIERTIATLVKTK